MFCAQMLRLVKSLLTANSKTQGQINCSCFVFMPQTIQLCFFVVRLITFVYRMQVWTDTVGSKLKLWECDRNGMGYDAFL